MLKLASVFAGTLALGSATAWAAQGTVFHDLNGNGIKDDDEPGIEGVRVSNQAEFDVTDAEGRWTLAHDEDTIFFVVKPRGWMTPVDENQIPQFYYIHKPAGSKPARFKGLDPTGPLPDSIDFPLTKQEEKDTFKAIFFGDTQTRSNEEVDYLTHDVIEPIIGNTDASFGVTLGDLLFDDLSVFPAYVQAISLMGLPWYSVIGNHDINLDAKIDSDSDETFHSWFGPNYFSFDHGPVHFVVLDNVWFEYNESRGRGGYVGRFGEEQIDWVEKDLAGVPDEKLVVLMMHIPLQGTQDAKELYKLISQRPYTLSASAHTHYQEHKFLKDPALGDREHHHVISVTACGSWWQGRSDERGIPHTTMRDGAPNGYQIFEFDGNQYKIQFRAAGMPAEYQMNIYAPDKVTIADLDSTEVFVNVFGGSERSKVEYRFGASGPWRIMDKVLAQDPRYATLVARDRGLRSPWRPLPGAMNSPHLWKAVLPPSLFFGTQPIHVRATDMHGQVFYATRGIRIVKSGT